MPLNSKTSREMITFEGKSYFALRSKVCTKGITLSFNFMPVNCCMDGSSNNRSFLKMHFEGDPVSSKMIAPFHRDRMSEWWYAEPHDTVFFNFAISWAGRPESSDWIPEKNQFLGQLLHGHTAELHPVLSFSHQQSRIHPSSPIIDSIY